MNDISLSAPETRREISQLLGISQATLRTWDRVFRRWLESPVGQKGNATRKRYTPRDVRVFQLIKRRRDEGLKLADIQQRLDADLVDEQLKRDVSAELTTRRDPVVVSDALAQRVRELESRLAVANAQVAALADERDRLEADLKLAQVARRDAERQAARLEGQIELLQEQLRSAENAQNPQSKEPPGWWRNFQR